MPQVKIILVCQGDDYIHTDKRFVVDSIVDWEEISDDDLRLLGNNFWKIIQQYSRNDLRPQLIIKDQVPVAEHIASIKSWLDEQRIAEDAEKIKKDAAAAERAKKKAAKKAQLDIELLNKLRKEYPNV